KACALAPWHDASASRGSPCLQPHPPRVDGEQDGQLATAPMLTNPIRLVRMVHKIVRAPSALSPARPPVRMACTARSSIPTWQGGMPAAELLPHPREVDGVGREWPIRLSQPSCAPIHTRGMG